MIVCIGFFIFHGGVCFPVRRHDDKVSHVINAVFCIARALHKVYIQNCPRMNGMCDELRNKLLAKDTSDFLIGNEIRDALYNETFSGVGGEEFRFNNNGDASGSAYTFNMFDARSRSYKTLFHWNISVDGKLDDKTSRKCPNCSPHSPERKSKENAVSWCPISEL